MSDLVKQDNMELGINLQQVLAQAGITTTVVKDGAKLSEFAVDRIKLTADHKVRVAFLTNYGFAYTQHYVDKFGSILCNGKDCCAKLSNIPNSIISKRIMFPVLLYETAVDGKLVSNQLSPDDVSLRVFSVTLNTYNSKIVDAMQAENFMRNDYALSSIKGQFEGGLDSINYVSSAAYLKFPEVKEKIFRELNAKASKLFDALARPFKLEEWEEHLKKSGNNVVASAPALPPSAVDVNAIDDNNDFVM